MEPLNPLPAAPAVSLHPDLSDQLEPLEPPPIVGPQPMVLPEDLPAKAAPPAAKSAKLAKSMPKKSVASSSSQSRGKEPVSSTIAYPISPSKRRNSQGPDGSSASVSNVDQTLAKRPKQDAAEPKALPLRYELVAIEDMAALIAHMLGELIETNDPLALRSGHLTRFHSRYARLLRFLPPCLLPFFMGLTVSRTAPGISVRDYLNRLAKHATLTPPLLLAMVYYIDRLCAMYPEFTINTLTVHRFLITAATVAAKGLSDSFWNNSTYARVGGVRVAELKLLELEFLYRVDWKIVPNPEVLVAYYRGLVERCPGYTLADETDDGEDEDEDEDSSDILDEEDEESGEDQGFGSGDEGQAEQQDGGGGADVPGDQSQGESAAQTADSRSGGNG